MRVHPRSIASSLLPVTFLPLTLLLGAGCALSTDGTGDALFEGTGGAPGTGGSSAGVGLGGASAKGGSSAGSAATAGKGGAGAMGGGTGATGGTTTGKGGSSGGTGATGGGGSSAGKGGSSGASAGTSPQGGGTGKGGTSSQGGATTTGGSAGADAMGGSSAGGGTMTTGGSGGTTTTTGGTGGTTTTTGGSGGTTTTMGGSGGTTTTTGGSGGTTTTTGGSAGSSGTGGSGPCTTPVGSCAATIPGGWTLALHEDDRSKTCPTGYTDHDIVSDPVAGGGACDCDCAVDASSTCLQGGIPTYLSAIDDKCGTTGTTVTAKGTSGCTSLGFSGNLSQHFAATAAPATVSCTASTATDKSKVAAKQKRLCDAPSACEEEVCNGTGPSGFGVCIYQAGDHTCPAGWSNKEAAGDDTTLSCSACTSCAATADCTNASITFFADNNCNLQGQTFDVDGSCQKTKGNTFVSAFEYSAMLSNAMCTGAGPKTATVGLDGQRTVCCK